MMRKPNTFKYLRNQMLKPFPLNGVSSPGQLALKRRALQEHRTALKAVKEMHETRPLKPPGKQPR